jgi:hypothetical protein
MYREDRYYSCFISYNRQDAAFVERLYDCLQTAGINCWKDDHQLEPGAPLYESIAEGIRGWDKFLLCCSEHSLLSWWVDNEVKTLLEKEQVLTKEFGSRFWLLLPLDLDGYIWSWNRGISTQIKMRHITKCDGWDHDASIIDGVCKKVIAALRIGEK